MRRNFVLNGFSDSKRAARSWRARLNQTRQAVPRTLRCTFPVKVFHTTDERWQAKKVRCKRSDRESEPEEPDDPLKFLRAIRRLSCRNRKRAWPRPPDPVLEEWVPMDLDLQETRRCKVLDQIAFGENSHF